MQNKKIFKDWKYLSPSAMAICLTLCILQEQENRNLKWNRVLVRIFITICDDVVLCALAQVYIIHFPSCYCREASDLMHLCRRIVTQPWLASTCDIAFELYHVIITINLIVTECKLLKSSTCKSTASYCGGLYLTIDIIQNIATHSNLTIIIILLNFSWARRLWQAPITVISKHGCFPGMFLSK